VRRLFLALAVLSLLSGCSALRLAYDNADTYLRWRASSYFDLHGDEADDLDDRIQDLLAWHRRQALPQYASILDETGRRLARGASRADLEWGYDAVVTQVGESLQAAAQRAAPVIDRLSPEQITHLEERFAEDNRKFAREFLRGSEAERRGERTRRMADRLEDWVGRLSEEQLDRVKQYSERAPLMDDLRDADRRRVQRDILAMARAKDAQKRLPSLAAGWYRNRERAFGAAGEAWKRELFAMLVDVERTLSEVQRARVERQIRRYAQDVRTLAARAAEARR
jgi:hypothetical protein